MKINNKIILPISIIISSIILGGIFYSTQFNKQKLISEQERKEYKVKRTKDCYDYETSERKKFDNIDGSFYDEENDVCKVRYINDEWKEGDPNSCGFGEKIFDEKSTCTIEHFFMKEF
jgi:hypothetical protein